MLDLSLAYTYAPVCVCLFKISFMCSMLYVFQVCGVPSFNAHVILGCLLFIDRTYYKEKIFNTNLFSAFVLFSVVLNRERTAHNQHSEAKWAITLVLNILWIIVGIGALLKLERKMTFLRYIRYDPLIVSCYFLSIHSFIYWRNENEVQTVLRIADFFLISVAWIYLFNSRYMKPKNVYNATECIIQFGHILFTEPPVSVTSTLIMCIILYIMRQRKKRAQLLCASGAIGSDTEDTGDEYEGNNRRDSAIRGSFCDEDGRLSDNEAMYKEPSPSVFTIEDVPQGLPVILPRPAPTHHNMSQSITQNSTQSIAQNKQVLSDEEMELFRQAKMNSGTVFGGPK